MSLGRWGTGRWWPGSAAGRRRAGAIAAVVVAVAVAGVAVAALAPRSGDGDDQATAVPAPSSVEGDDQAGDGDGAANPALRAELLRMAEEDQAVRTGVAPEGDDRTADELFADWDRVDAANAARIEEILDEHGWPGWSLVGRDGSTAAWVLVQHADLHPDLQRRGLALLEEAVAAGDASPGDLAYLVDRVRVAEGRPQVYGTQWGAGADGEMEPRTPIEDEENVDERRRAAGLEPLEDYIRELEAIDE